jgi:SAM-dependent methyltransferase
MTSAYQVRVAMSVTLKHPQGLVHIEQTQTEKWRIAVSLFDPRAFVRTSTWQTSYPIDLIERILRVKGPAYLCDEIMRDEDPNYVQCTLEQGTFAYVPQDCFASRRILDFGCGSGASTMILARILPACNLVGVELDGELLSVAKLRAQHYKLNNVHFIRSPDPTSLPADIGDFDYIFLNAVYEHLLPNERRNLLPVLWSHLKRQGILFINGTPHRFSPIESHTTGLPLINFLPAWLTLALTRRFSRRAIERDETWQTLLRKGIRGGTVTEIMHILNATDDRPVLLEPSRFGTKDRIDLWYHLSGSGRFRAAKKIVMYLLKMIRSVTGMTFVPYLSLAIRKTTPQ